MADWQQDALRLAASRIALLPASDQRFLLLFWNKLFGCVIKTSFLCDSGYKVGCYLAVDADGLSRLL